jgi:hypothetical protein
MVWRRRPLVTRTQLNGRGQHHHDSLRSPCAHRHLNCLVTPVKRPAPARFAARRQDHDLGSIGWTVAGVNRPEAWVSVSSGELEQARRLAQRGSGGTQRWPNPAQGRRLRLVGRRHGPGDGQPGHRVVKTGSQAAIAPHEVRLATTALRLGPDIGRGCLQIASHCPDLVGRIASGPRGTSFSGASPEMRQGQRRSRTWPPACGPARILQDISRESVAPPREGRDPSSGSLDAR